MTRVSRRALLRGSLAALAAGSAVGSAAGSAAGGAIACSRSSERSERAAPSEGPKLGERERVVFEHLRGLMPYLDAEAAMLDFARAHVTAGRGFREQRPDPDVLVTVFLLSTDFFQTGADPKRRLRFTRLHSPLDACANPFAQLGPADGA